MFIVLGVLVICHLVALGYMKLHKLTGIHIESYDTILHLIKFDVLFTIENTFWIQIIAYHLQPWSLNRTLDCQWSDSAEHVT